MIHSSEMNWCSSGEGKLSLEDLQIGIRRATMLRHSIDEVVYIYEAMLAFSSKKAVGFEEFDQFIRHGSSPEPHVVRTDIPPVVYNVSPSTPSPEQQRAAARIRQWSRSPPSGSQPSPTDLAVTLPCTLNM